MDKYVAPDGCIYPSIEAYYEELQEEVQFEELQEKDPDTYWVLKAENEGWV